MDTLPAKVLKRIFEKVPEEELRTLKEVSRAWADLIDLELGIPAYLGNGNESYWLQNVEWSSISRISEIGISKAYFSEIQEELPLLGFKSPELVQEVSFDGFVSEKSFARLIALLPNLQVVKIHTSTLCYLRSNYLKEWNLPLLKDLHIVSYGTDGQDSWSHRNDHILDSTDIILRSNRFPKLRRLILNMLFVPRREKDLTDAILECVVTHKSSLRSLGMEYQYEGESNDLGLNFDPDDSSKWLIKLNGLQLNKFSLQFYYDGAPKTDFWKEFLASQNGLCKIDYICGNGFIPFPTALILRNHSSLVQIHLKVHIKEDEFDCSIFQDCRLLKALALVNKSSVNQFEREELKSPILKNAGRLPKTILKLFLGYFRVTKWEAKVIAFELPLLQELCLSVIGMSGDYGIEMQDVGKLLGQKKLQKIAIWFGVNQHSIQYDRQTAKPEDLLTTLLFRIDPNVNCYLNSKGIYESAQPLVPLAMPGYQEFLNPGMEIHGPHFQ